MVALLHSMSTYDNYLSRSKQQQQQQQYAKQNIQTALLHYLARSSHPLRLPAALQTADAAASRLRAAHKREPTLLQVADAAGVPPQRLALYRKLRRGDDWETRSPERIVAPLRDVICDTEEVNNPDLYTHHLRMSKELDEFLRETLTPEELLVIQLRFGLVESRFGGRGWSAGQIGERMGIEKDEVVRVASGALEKLRKAAMGDDPFVEVSL
ncbi:hypothetical protein ACHAWX_007641 [Stephanocyclus meneghinianus]